jgi:site-specific DNA recombinase
VSSDRQAQQNTIASQIAMIRTFAVAQGVRIDAALIFAANGISGTPLARPQLEVLRAKAAAGELEQILILTPDR